MKLLCISRKHPPSVGGMQQMNYELIRRLAACTDATVIKWGHSQVFLPFFLLRAFFRSLILLPKNTRPDVIYLGDALLAPLGRLLKTILRRPVAVTTHGLDLTFRFPFYRTLISLSLRRLDRVIGVSAHTTGLCIGRGVDESRCVTIPNGVDCAEHTPSPSDTESARNWLREKCQDNSPEHPIILTVGRLVKRKGIVPFIEKTLPLLVESYPRLIYVIVGEGRERKRIETKIQRRHLEKNALVTGYLPLTIVRGLMALAKIFVMPNVSVPGDVEGFGLVALEAGCAGLPVVASDLEGIREALTHGENGFLVPSHSPDHFAATIEKLLGDEKERENAGARAKKYTMENFSWDSCAQLYLQEFQKIIT